MTFLCALARCAYAAVHAFAALPRALGGAVWAFLKALGHGLWRILSLFARGLRTVWRRYTAVARAVYKELRWEGQGRAAAFLRALGRLLLSENGLLPTLFRFAVPVCCCAFLVSVTAFGVREPLGVRVRLGTQTLGVVESERVYMEAREIVRQRLSYAKDSPEVSLSGRLRLETLDEQSVLLTAPELADKMLRTLDVTLCEGWGVFVRGEFLGAVQNREEIEHALQHEMTVYLESLPFAAQNPRYSDEVTFESGTYLSENLTPESEVIARLTQKTALTRVYTAKEYETVYSVAERFLTTPEEIERRNPELEEELPAVPRGTAVTVPVTERYLPIAFERELRTLSFPRYETVRIETDTLPLGVEKTLTKGENGTLEHEVSAHYENGREVSRRTLSTRVVREATDEEIGVGTYAPAPMSETTVLTGSGRFSWPVDGGYISDVFISNRNHKGLDIAAPGGTAIYAAGDGVVRVSTMGTGYGNYIIIDHGDGFETLYGHASMLLAGAGQRVRRGQVIALVGTTGDSTGNHLHFEVRVNGVHFDPALFLRVNAD